MRSMEQSNADTGVVVGRWQVDDLHGAHLDLIETVQRAHQRLIVFVGISDILGKIEDPLDYPTRAAMILSHFPGAIVLPIQDKMGDNGGWSKNLDTAIKAVAPVGKVILYGGRGSFLNQYVGVLPTHEFESIDHPSGTEIREEVGRIALPTRDFRAGCIYEAYQTYPRLNMVVDVAVIRRVTVQDEEERPIEKRENYVLLGQKAGDNGLRFPGGFVNVGDPSLEAAARRECVEETGILPETLKYYGSFPIEDSRMGNRDGMMTAFFIGTALGNPKIKVKDDLDQVEWVGLDKLRGVPWYRNHVPMFEALCTEMGL